MVASGSVSSQDEVETKVAAQGPLALDEDIAYNLYFPDDYDNRRKHLSDLDIEKNDAESDTDIPVRSIPLFKKIWDAIYPGYFVKHLNYKLFRIVFPTWLGIFVGVVLHAVDRTRSWLGPAAYLIVIIAAVAAPGGKPLILSVMVAVVLLFFMVVAWIHGIVAQAIVAHLRGWPSKEQIVKEIVLKGVCQENDPKLKKCVQEYLFTGAYLETRYTVIWIFAFMFCLVGTRGVLRYNPLLKVGYLFAAGMVSVAICYNIYFPFFDPLIVGAAAFKPAGLSFVLTCIISGLVFPQTALFKFIEQQAGIVDALLTTHRNNTRLVTTLRPSKANFDNYMNHGRQVTAEMKNVVKLESMAAISQYEVAYLRFDMGDVARIRAAVKNMITALAGFDYYYMLFEERRLFAQNQVKTLSHASTRDLSPIDMKVKSTIAKNAKEAGSFEHGRKIRHIRQRLFKMDPKKRVSLDDLDTIAIYIGTNLASFGEAIERSLLVASKWFNEANHFRAYSLVDGSYSRRKGVQQQMALEVKDALCQLEEQLAISSNFQVFEEHMERSELLGDALICLITQTTLYTESCRSVFKLVHKFLSVLQEIDVKKPVPNLVTPLSHYRERPKHIFQTDTQIDDEANTDAYTMNIANRDPDNYPPINKFQKVGKTLVDFYREEILNERFWGYVKGAILVVLLAFPFFFRSTAYMFYDHRMIWLPIMTAMSLTETTGQTIYMFGAKVIYSIIGCVVAMVCWYISVGNAIGYAAVSGVVFGYLVFHRHFSQHEALVPSILVTVTTAMVLGTVFTQADNGRSKYALGWKVAMLRLVSVVIGLAIAAGLSLVPRPQLSKTLLRRLLLTSVNDCGNLHCLVAKFAQVRARNPEVKIKFRNDYVTEQFRELFFRMETMLSLTLDLRHELPIAGYWPETKYDRLRKVLNDVVQLYYLIYQMFDNVHDPEKFMPTCFDRTGWNLTDFLADMFLVVYMLTNSLRTTDPLPRISLATLSVKHMELLLDQWGMHKLSFQERWENQPTDETTEEQKLLEESDAKVMKHLDYRQFFTHDGQYAINVLLYAHMLYLAYDEMVVILKSLVGEKYDYNEQILKDFKPKIGTQH